LFFFSSDFSSSSLRQQYGFDDTTASASTATLSHRHEIASTSINEIRKTASTRKVGLLTGDRTSSTESN
jgi:hypothetical protein